MFLRLVAFLTVVIFSFAAWAQETADSPEATQKQASWAPNPNNDTVLAEISNAIGASALNNITNSEQVFCYQIATKPDNYTGYTLDGMALVGFCGVLNKELQGLVKSELLMNPDNLSFDTTENCVIRPKIMLRFVRGVDSTDMLLSSPCHAVAIFYGGKISAFNAKPAAQIIDALVTPLIKNKVDFASPALFNQLLPVGVAQTDEQKALLQKKNEPVRSWQKEQQQDAARRSGWNKLKAN